MRLLELERAHVVLTVCQLDDGHADIMRHGQDHLADILGLSLFLGVKGHLADFRYAVDDIRHLFPEFRFQLVNGGAGILHGIMQQSGRHGMLVKTHLGKGQRHRGGMHHVRLAGKTHLTGVCGCRVVIGFADHGFVRAGIVTQQRVDDFVGLGHAAAPVGLKPFLLSGGMD